MHPKHCSNSIRKAQRELVADMEKVFDPAGSIDAFTTFVQKMNGLASRIEKEEEAQKTSKSPW